MTSSILIAAVAALLLAHAQAQNSTEAPPVGTTAAGNVVTPATTGSARNATSAANASITTAASSIANATLPANTTVVTATTARPATNGTNATVPASISTCFNGGYLVDKLCNCPSGYFGVLCEQKFDGQLCDRIVCKNAGFCAIRNPNGPYESICFCRSGTFGEYCQLNGTLGSCRPNLCSNAAPCKENLVATTRHAYCDCLPGYNGRQCEIRYFQCQSSGFFMDAFLNQQGRYFECKAASAGFQLIRRSCPRGLRFNANKNNSCTVF